MMRKKSFSKKKTSEVTSGLILMYNVAGHGFANNLIPKINFH